VVSQRYRITLFVFWIIFVLACISAIGRAESPRYVGDFRIAFEPGYSNTADGVQFIALQRIDSKAIDRAVLSIDADLPLAVALKALKDKRIRITVDAVEPPVLGELKR
jgi:hypothetical protein